MSEKYFQNIESASAHGNKLVKKKERRKIILREIFINKSLLLHDRYFSHSTRIFSYQ